MKVDRMFFQQFEEKVKTDVEIKQLMEAGDVEVALSLIHISEPTRPY